MESAATPTKPKRSRAVKPQIDAPEAVEAPAKRSRATKKPAVEVAPAFSHRERMAQVDARAAETRKRVEAEYAEKGYGPMPRTSFRWIGRRTKGLPYSRMIADHVVPGVQGMPGVIHARHPTRKTGIKKLTATPAILEIFMPSLTGHLTAAMLGTN